MVEWKLVLDVEEVAGESYLCSVLRAQRNDRHAWVNVSMMQAISTGLIIISFCEHTGPFSYV